MSKKAKQTDRRITIIGAADAKAPPVRAVRESLAKLRRSISERQQKRSHIFTEQNKLRLEINAPILDLMKSDSRSKAASKALRKSYDNLWTDLAVDSRSAPQLAYDIHHPTDSEWFVSPSYPNHYAFHHRADEATSEENGHLHGSVNPDGGNAWVWAGVGFPLVPGRDCRVRVTPHMYYRYKFAAACNAGVSAHCEGALGIHVHRYDGDWQDTDPTQDFPQDFHHTIWSHTTETVVCQTSFVDKADYWPVFSESTLLSLQGDSNYLIWATLEVSANCTGDGLVFFSRISADFWANCAWISAVEEM
jgi:hypothetical protein